MSSKVEGIVSEMERSLKRAEYRAGIAFGIAIIAIGMNVLPDVLPDVVPFEPVLFWFRTAMAIILAILGFVIICKSKKPSK